jgi:hypothetical protein
MQTAEPWTQERKKDSLLAVAASSFVELESFQCSRRPVGREKVL